jgi:poly(3-hydroxybutyrate) depolymerase
VNTLSGRQYTIRLPSDYDSNKAYRLVFGFHWLGGNMKNVVDNSYYGLLPLDTEKTAIFVSPQGNDNGWANPNGADIKFVDDMLKAFEDDLCVDTTKIFSLGFSYGGGMSYAIACARAKVFRAVAIYDGGVISGCSGGNDPIAYFQSHGVSDNVLGMSGAHSMRDRFVKNNGCTSQTPSEPQPGSKTHTTADYAGCKPGYPLEWVAFDGGHEFSPCDGGCGGGRQSYLPAMTWKFFTALP